MFNILKRKPKRIYYLNHFKAGNRSVHDTLEAAMKTRGDLVRTIKVIEVVK